MATLHALHGLPGSGKTTFARKLADELPAVRFTPDEWMIALHGTNPAEALFREQHPRILALIMEHARRVLAAGVDVILDIGFWTRASRDEIRQRAAEWNVTLKFYALDCPAAIARQRVQDRTHRGGTDALVIDEAAFDQFLAQFEPMDSSETHLVVSN